MVSIIALLLFGKPMKLRDISFYQVKESAIPQESLKRFKKEVGTLRGFGWRGLWVFFLN